MSAEEAFQRLMTDIDINEEDMQEIENEEDKDHFGRTSFCDCFWCEWNALRKDENCQKDSGGCQWQNSITHKPGATAFIMNRVNSELDIFLELLGRDWVRKITAFTVKESHRQNHSRFSSTENELLGFLGLCTTYPKGFAR